MFWGILAIVVCILLGIAEWLVYDHAIYWHSKEKGDPRNFPPPR